MLINSINNIKFYDPLFQSGIRRAEDIIYNNKHIAMNQSREKRQDYMHQSKLTFSNLDMTNYDQLLQRYDKILLQKIRQSNPDFLEQSVHLIKAQLQPQNLKWIIWKNSEQILSFIDIFQKQINQMLSSSARAGTLGTKILQNYQNIRQKNLYAIDQNSINEFIAFLNLVASQPFLYKSEEFLLFIQHCISVDKWNTKIFQQLTVNKAPTIVRALGKTITKPCSGQAPNHTSADRDSFDRDYFITITSDGILKSQNHLMESVITSMIPFTNQFQSICDLDDENLSFSVTSCYHEKINIHFYKDYAKGVNFAVGLRMALKQSGYSDPHRFQSFAPIRQNCACKLYNDGIGYFSDLYSELMKAQKQVCITGWMITPYFQLRRPTKITSQKYRLDKVLESLALRGIKIFIIAFKQPKLFVNNDSQHVEYYLQSLHRNIKVIRHPDNMIPLLWSHHEKMVIIDQKIGFMGGLDICYGRWDNPEHLLKDPGDLWDGCDYTNARTSDIYEARNFTQTNLNPHFQVRMPWHDIAIQYRGDVVLDLLRHFVQYWYFVKWDEQFTLKQVMGLLTSKTTARSSTKQLQSQGYKDYLQHNKKDVKDKLKQKKSTLKLKHKQQDQQRTDETIPQLFIETRSGQSAGTQTLQMCRSASTWSIGIPQEHHESSIHNAYQNLIINSQRFIYIQNQFFMGLENKIVECLANRILRAHRDNSQFKVIIVLPLLPGFEGDIANPASSVLRIQVHHQYNSICRSKNSLFQKLKQIPNTDDYIHIFGLRKAEVVDDVPMTQMIYVHSKLMIVDDERAIIGSANINDRSLLGSRDSELACIIEEEKGKIFGLRASLFQEHFGLTRQQSYNHMHLKVWNKILGNSKRNTDIFRSVFGCIPDDNITIVGQINKLSIDADILLYSRLQQQIIGHAVDYPLKFLCDEDLTFRLNQKEFFAPQSSFT